jgi:uncharacterized protein YndB with AHSA1/START domain
MLDGHFSKRGDGGVLSFERHIDRPIEKVWAALTIAERVSDWSGHAEIDLRVGGRFHITWPNDMGEMNGVITACEPPTLLEYSWHEPTVKLPPSKVRWTLKPDGAGCFLTLQHIYETIDADSVADFAGGWDGIIDDMVRAADGLATPMDNEAFKVRKAGYMAKFCA